LASSSTFQLHVFLGAEFVELDVFGTVELERSWKNGSRAVPNTPLEPHMHLVVFQRFKAILGWNQSMELGLSNIYQF
jgi:hypothetical protein